jgi:hypothetical protein
MRCKTTSDAEAPRDALRNETDPGTCCCCRPNNGSAIATSNSPTISLTGSRLSSDGAAGRRLRSTSGGSTSTISAASTRSTRPTLRRPRLPGPSSAPRSTLPSLTSATIGGQARSGPSTSRSCGKRLYVYPALNRGLRRRLSHADGNACFSDEGHLGGATKDGPAPQGVPASYPSPDQQRRVDLARVQRVRKQPRQADGAASFLPLVASQVCEVLILQARIDRPRNSLPSTRPPT